MIDSLEVGGGTERVCVNLANAISKDSDFRVVIFVLNGNGAFYEINNGVEVIFIENQLTISSEWVKILSVMKSVRQRKIESLICVSMGALSFKSSILYSIFHRRHFKFLASEHVAFHSFSTMKRAIKRIGYKLSSMVVVLTESDLKSLNTLGHTNIHCIPNFVPSSFSRTTDIERSSASDGETLYLAVGRLTYQKNFDSLIELWHRAGELNHEFKKGSKLVIVGEGEDKNKLLAMINDLKLTTVNIVPPTLDISSWYQRADCFVMTSRYEGLPMVLIESQAHGVPAIAFDCPTGPSDIIKDGLNGYLIAPKDDDMFVSRLIETYDDVRTRDELSETSRLLSQRFAEENVVNYWKKIIRSIT
ncbi:glycosyltransferase [Halomonas sp. DP5Y7-2]|uniref:glycosyltransferase n=1 Tax=Halomonas sp. DP5Y7-2 TaxID=2859076 RepID=UPI001C99A90C|nr:glycosyltransferase [Halomonas sp. DP5Y7-2]MBY5985172.1 glycosyltransferase [Halomonas sp. DP5Y7-2]